MTPHADSAAGRAILVAIACDDPLATAFHVRQISELGHEAQVMPVDGPELAETVQTFAPDLVIIDLDRPPSEISQLTRTLKEQRPNTLVFSLKPGDRQELLAALELATLQQASTQTASSRRAVASRWSAGEAPPTAQPRPRVGAESPSEELMDVPVHRHTEDRPASAATQVPDGAVRLVLIDAHQLLAESLAHVLALDPAIDVVGIQSRPERALSTIKQAQPHVVLLSYFLMQYENGGLTRAIRDELPQTRILVLVSSDEADTLLSCIEAGAVGYVSRDSSPTRLVELVKRASQGETLFPSHILVDLMRSRLRPQVPDQPDLNLRLTPREIEVLQLLALGRTTRQVSDELVITLHTVRTHLKNAMAKLRVHSKFDAILLAQRAGLIELPPQGD